jgi:hypothetical protein
MAETSEHAAEVVENTPEQGGAVPSEAPPAALADVQAVVGDAEQQLQQEQQQQQYAFDQQQQQYLILQLHYCFAFLNLLV